MKKITTLCFILTTVAACVNVQAAVINVPGDQATIGAAIAAASPGDTINVGAGIYAENLVIDKQLILQGAGSGSTEIDAGGVSHGILLSTGGTLPFKGMRHNHQ